MQATIEEAEGTQVDFSVFYFGNTNLIDRLKCLSPYYVTRVHSHISKFMCHMYMAHGLLNS